MTDPVPAPGGTALLAGKLVARIGFGVMQLERPAVTRAIGIAQIAGGVLWVIHQEKHEKLLN